MAAACARVAGRPSWISQHEAACPPPRSDSGGSSRLHRSMANGQRGWNLQPDGNSSGFGTSPVIVASRDLCSPILGRAWKRPIVYGCVGVLKSVATSAYSTILPAYITATSWEISATTPRSWVMISTPMPTSACSERIRSRIWAWIVTSSAVVGSSAMRSFGLQTSDIAIITRWRMPPDSWCG